MKDYLPHLKAKVKAQKITLLHTKLILYLFIILLLVQKLANIFIPLSILSSDLVQKNKTENKYAVKISTQIALPSNIPLPTITRMLPPMPTASINKPEATTQANTTPSQTLTPAPQTPPTATPQNARAYAATLVSAEQFNCLDLLWNKESGWNAYAVNSSSGAAGIPQALGHGYVFNLGDYISQVNWGINYIQSVYQTPCNAWVHETKFNSY